MIARVLLVVLTIALPRVASAVDDPDTEIARRHFAAGVKLYDAGNYEQAVMEFQAARRVKPSPAFDYNIARCFDRLERVDDAITYYQSYVDTNPAPGQDGGARARLAVLQTRRQDALVASVTAPAEPAHDAAEPRPTRYRVAVPAAVGGVAVAALVVGGALYGASGASWNHYNSECGPAHGMSCPESVWGGTRTEERAGIGLMVAGGVVAAVDVVLWAAWRKHR